MHYKFKKKVKWNNQLILCTISVYSNRNDDYKPLKEKILNINSIIPFFEVSKKNVKSENCLVDFNEGWKTVLMHCILHEWDLKP